MRPLALYPLFVTTDADEARTEVARIYCDHKLSPLDGTGRVDAWQNATRLRQMTLCAMGYGADVAVDPGSLNDFYLLMFPYAGSAEIQAGGQSVLASANTAVLLNPSDPVKMRWAADCAKIMVRIERSAVERRLVSLLGREMRGPLNFKLAIPVSGQGRIWRRLVELMIAQMETEECPGAGSLTMAALESALLTSILERQANSYSEMLRFGASGIAPRHVRAVEQYIEANAAEPICTEDLVNVSGVSARALFDGFRRFRDISPMAHLRKVRLGRVREDLLQAPDGATVADIACRWGFIEMGRFAGQYRRLFGESPSETLRRR